MNEKIKRLLQELKEECEKNNVSVVCAIGTAKNRDILIGGCQLKQAELIGMLLGTYTAMVDYNKGVLEERELSDTRIDELLNDFLRGDFR